jgi:hypothetical protein
MTVDKSAFAISTNVTIRGSSSGITIQRGGTGPEMRVFRVTPSGTLTLESITVAGGFVRGAPGVIPNSAGGDARGGAIFNQGTLRIVASTFVGSEVRGGDGIGTGPGGGARGGAVYNDGGTVMIVNATVSNNTAQSGSGPATPPSFGGGIYSRNGVLEIDNSTIANNTSAAGRGVYVLADSGNAAVDVHSSIIGQAAASPTIFDFFASAEADGILEVTGVDNMIRRQNAFSEITFSIDDPLLGPLVNNGGPTHTHALMLSSPAINRGSNRLAVSTDQRGASHSRVVGGQADIGAFEVQAFDGPDLPGDYNRNDVVDAADYVIWRKTLGTFAANLFAGADGDGNGRIDTEDYSVWRTRFGAINSAVASIEIPSSGSTLDSPPAGAEAISFDLSSFDGAAATKGRSSQIELTSGIRQFSVGAGQGELLNVVASAFPALSEEDAVWESAQSHASEGPIDDWDGGVGDGAMNIAFDSFGLVSQHVDWPLWAV